LKFDLRTSCKPGYGNSLQTAALLAKNRSLLRRKIGRRLAAVT
jgi:hypothetical protein